MHLYEAGVPLPTIGDWLGYLGIGVIRGTVVKGL